MANHLIKLINSGTFDEVEHITQKLAELRPNIQFNLLSKNDNQESNMLESKPNGYTLRSPHSVLQSVYNIFHSFFSSKYLDYHFESNVHCRKIL